MTHQIKTITYPAVIFECPFCEDDAEVDVDVQFVHTGDNTEAEVIGAGPTWLHHCEATR